MYEIDKTRNQKEHLSIAEMMAKEITNFGVMEQNEMIKAMVTFIKEYREEQIANNLKAAEYFKQANLQLFE